MRRLISIGNVVRVEGTTERRDVPTAQEASP